VEKGKKRKKRRILRLEKRSARPKGGYVVKDYGPNIGRRNDRGSYKPLPSSNDFPKPLCVRRKMKKNYWQSMIFLHVRTTNPIESSFSIEKKLAMMLKLSQ